MNDKKDESNKSELSFFDKIKLFNLQANPQKRKTTTIDKNIPNNLNDNNNKIPSKNNINNDSKIENKNKIKENEKISKLNNIKTSSTENKNSEKKENFELNDNKSKSINYLKPIISDSFIKEINPNIEKDELIEKPNNLKNIDESKDENEDNNLINNNENDIIDFKNSTNDLDIKGNNSKIDEIDDLKKEININKFSNKDNIGYNNEEIKIKINEEISSLQDKRYSMYINTDNVIQSKEKSTKNLSPKEKISRSPKLGENQIINHRINAVKEYGSNNYNINHINNNKEIKKKEINPPKQIKKLNNFSEKNEKNINIIKTKNNIKIKKNGEIILEETQVKSDIKKNSFCKAFIAASIPQQNMNIIKDSENEIQNCRHEECSLLPAIEPELIYKYPAKDDKDLEISNIAASLCFPQNIKICFCEDESKVLPEKNYKTCLTNQMGDRFYTMINHFFIRMTIDDFCQKYQNDEYIEKLKDIINSKNVKYIYIPYCICLISRFSFFKEMNICLESIFLSLRETNITLPDLNEIISYLINSIPSPYINTSVNFPIPNCVNLIELYPCLYREMPVYNTSPSFLLDIINPENILLLMRLLLLEQKILLISDDYDTLTKVSLNLISLMYPFPWINIYVPILSHKLIKLLESFLPFFFGMHKSLYIKEDVQKIISKSQKNLYIFDIEKNTLELSKNVKNKTKVDPMKYLNSHVPSFPKKIEELITEQLRTFNSLNEKSLGNKNAKYANKNTDKNLKSNCIKIKEIFLQGYIELFHNYKNYLTFIEDSPVFNMIPFIKEKPDNEKIFFKEFTSTQIFQIFIQNSASYMNDYNKKFYFDELIEDYLIKKSNNNNGKNENRFYIILNDEFEKKMDNFLFKINKNYYIKPSSNFKFFKHINNIIRNKKGNYINHLKMTLKKESKFQNLLKIDGTVKPNKKIITKDFNIFYEQNINNDINNPEYYSYFITDEEKEENEEISHKINTKNINIDINNNKYNDMNEIQIESIKDDINAKVRKIFKSEKTNVKRDSEELLSLLETDLGKDYFLSLLIKNINLRQNKYISENCFLILFEVLTKSLIKLSKTNQENQEDIIYIMKLLKSIKFFNTIIEKEELSMIQKIIEYLSNKHWDLFKSEFFWELWVEKDLMVDNKELYDIFNDVYEKKDILSNYIDEEDEQVINFKNNFKEYLEQLVKLMMFLKCDKSLILTIVDYLCDKYIQYDDEFKSLIISEIREIGKI